jgi:hypothetical protein
MDIYVYNVRAKTFRGKLFYDRLPVAFCTDCSFPLTFSKKLLMKMKSITWAVALLLAGVAMTSGRADESQIPPKPLNVLLIGNSQCPTIVRNQLLEKLAAADKGGRPIKIGGCIKGGRVVAIALGSRHRSNDCSRDDRKRFMGLRRFARHLQRQSACVSAVRAAVPCVDQKVRLEDGVIRHCVDP